MFGLAQRLVVNFELFADGLVFESHSAQWAQTGCLWRLQLCFVELRFADFDNIRTILKTQLPTLFYLTHSNSA